MTTRSLPKQDDSAVKSSPVKSKVLSDVTDKVISNMTPVVHEESIKKDGIKATVDRHRDAPLKITPNTTPVVNEESFEKDVIQAAVYRHRNSPMKVKSNTTPVLHESVEKDGIMASVDRHRDDPLTIYWLSTEAKKLFRPKGGETVLEAIDAQMELLSGAVAIENWRAIVDPQADLQEEFYLVPGAIDRIRDKAMYVSAALEIAKRDKPTKTWAQCCRDADKLISTRTRVQIPDPASANKVMSWYREFRENRFFLSRKKLKEEAKRNKELIAARKEVAVLLAKIEKGMASVKIENADY